MIRHKINHLGPEGQVKKANKIVILTLTTCFESEIGHSIFTCLLTWLAWLEVPILNGPPHFVTQCKMVQDGIRPIVQTK